MTALCASCDKALSAVNTSGLCRRCCGVALGGRQRKHPKVYCRVCSKLVRGTTGYCRAHFVAERLNAPEIAERRQKGLDRYFSENPEKVAAHGGRILKRLWNDPAFRERARRKCRAIQPLGQVAAQCADSRAKAGRSISDRRLAWCPLERRDEYRRLMKRIGAKEARARIEGRAPERRRRTFEETLHLVETGRARIVANVKVRAPEPSFSIVGGTDWGAMG